MLLYIMATPRVISVVIVVERTKEGNELPIQHPVYYLSEVLTFMGMTYGACQGQSYLPAGVLGVPMAPE
jgi:hypothetical protein